MPDEKLSKEVLRGCPQGRLREEVVSGGPQKSLREERKSSQEVSQGVSQDVARENLWKTRLREEAVIRGPIRRHERRSSKKVAKGGTERMF